MPPIHPIKMLENDGLSDDVSDWGSDFDDVEEDQQDLGHNDLYEIPDGKPAVATPVAQCWPKIGTSTISLNSSSSVSSDENIRPASESYVESVPLPTRVSKMNKDEVTTTKQTFIESLKRKLSQRTLSGKSADYKNSHSHNHFEMHRNNLSYNGKQGDDQRVANLQNSQGDYLDDSKLKVIHESMQKHPWFYRVDRSKAELILENSMSISPASSIQTPWSFRDGREYIIGLDLYENPKGIKVKISDKITAEEWSCDYDYKFIEGITQRTGSFKPFDTFVSMIKSAIFKKSESVSIELMNLEDLEILRTQKRETAKTSMISSKTASNNIASKFENSNKDIFLGRIADFPNGLSLNNKKYLIITYIAEFDRVHYPIPLLYSGPPNPATMQNNIRKLMTEVSQLKSTNQTLEKELASAKTTLQQPKISNRAAERIIAPDDPLQLTGSVSVQNSFDTVTPTPQMPFGMSTQVSNAKDINQNYENIVYRNSRGSATYPTVSNPPEKAEVCSNSLFSIDPTKMHDNNDIRTCQKEEVDVSWLKKQFKKTILALQELQEKMHGDHKKYEEMIERLNSENLHLKDQIENLKKGEGTLLQEMKRLDKLIALNGKDNDKKTTNGDLSLSESCSRSRSRFRTASLNKRAHGFEEHKQNFRSRGNSLRCSNSVSRSNSMLSMSKDGAQGTLTPLNVRIRSCSPRNRARFDPTAYVQEKRMKQKLISQMRIANIESHLHSHESRERLVDAKPSNEALNTLRAPEADEGSAYSENAYEVKSGLGRTTSLREASPSPERRQLKTLRKDMLGRGEVAFNDSYNRNTHSWVDRLSKPKHTKTTEKNREKNHSNGSRTGTPDNFATLGRSQYTSQMSRGVSKACPNVRATFGGKSKRFIRTSADEKIEELDKRLHAVQTFMEKHTM